MRAVVYQRFGGPEVLELVERPVPPVGPKQLRIRVRATTVTAAESAMRQGLPRWGRMIIGLTRPRRRFRTLGNELAGVVDAVGRGVHRFKEGDEVFGFAGWNIGANADYMILPESASLALKPPDVSFGDCAAAVDGPTTALFFLRDKARLEAGQRVLVVGASGSIGTFAVQLASRRGAHVTAVCSGRNAELVRSLGADRVIDYHEHDWTELGDTYDVVFDTVGASSFAKARRALGRRGIFLPTVITARSVLQGALTPLLGGPRVIGGMSVEKREAMQHVRELLIDGALRVVVERRLPIDRIADAHRLVDSGRKRGNVVIELS